MIVALKRHANELYELSSEELAGFWSEVAATAKAVSQVFNPVKLYYGVFGGRCPHIHCHILPRYHDSDPHAPVAMGIANVFLEQSEYARVVAELRKHLHARQPVV